MTDRRTSVSPDTQRAIETFLDEQMLEHDVPGLSITVVDRDGVCYATGMGARNIDARAPATPDTLYSIASVTKTFTAIATLQLVEAGELNLSDEIGDYVPYWSDVPGEPITVHDLLSHSSGMPSNYVGQRGFLFSETQPTTPVLTRDDYIRHYNGASDHRVSDLDGYLYSNEGYFILGELITEVSDRQYADHVENDIFSPLGMDRSQVGHGKLSETDEDSITGYIINDGEPVANEFDLESALRPPYSAGGILSSMTDLARLSQCLLNGGELDGTRILSTEMVEEMSTHQAPTWETVDGHERGYGYGQKIQTHTGEPFVGHTGTAGGVCRAFVGMLPESNLGVSLGTNTAGVPIETLAQGVLAIVQDQSPVETVPRLSVQHKIDAVTGRYRGYRGGLTADVEQAEDAEGCITITYQDGPEWEFSAVPESTVHDEYRFHTVWGDGKKEPVVFRDTSDGMVMRCNIDRLERTSTDI